MYHADDDGSGLYNKWVDAFREACPNHEAWVDAMLKALGVFSKNMAPRQPSDDEP